jgi:MATE family multidrug resistance protein
MRNAVLAREDRANVHPLAAFRREMRPMLHIALPLVLAEVGWMSMGLVDTVMVGHLPDAAVPLSAAALAQVLYNTFAFGVGGILLGLDTTISQAHGAGDYKAAHRWLFQGILLAGAISLFLIALSLLSPLGFAHLHADPAVIAGAIPTLRALSWGTFPLLLYFALRRHLQAFNHVRIIAATLVSANLVNLLFDWLLIFGHRWELHLAGATRLVQWNAMGVVGSGIATSLARVYQALFLIAALAIVDRTKSYGLLAGGLWRSLTPDWQRLKRLLQLGVPSGATILVEILIFAVVTSIISLLGPVPLAGHEIALNCISFTFMIPLGISAAASVRVGQAIGRGAPVEAKAAGWAAIALGAGFMTLSCGVFLTMPRLLSSAFTHDAAVIAAAVPLMLVAAIFQFCDGLQVTAIGALRGAGDTKSGLITHLCSYWLLGLPLGLFLCFTRKLGARGLWLGLSASLVVSGIVLLLLWRRKKIESDSPIALPSPKTSLS